ncbi:Zinc finger and SCAN domain-containing protein 10, partial [Folsomia candida]
PNFCWLQLNNHSFIIPDLPRIAVSLRTKAIKMFLVWLEVSAFLFQIIVFLLVQFLPCTPPFILSMLADCGRSDAEPACFLNYVARFAIQMFETWMSCHTTYSGTTWILYVLFVGINFLLCCLKLLSSPATFSSPGGLRRHKRIHTEEKLICQICGASLTNQRYLDDHIFNWHTKQRNFPCPKCPKIFKLDKYLEKHVKKKHPPGSKETSRDYACPQCDKGFPSSLSLQRHTQIVHADPVICHKAGRGKEFARKTELHLHLKKNHRCETKKK